MTRTGRATKGMQAKLLVQSWIGEQVLHQVPMTTSNRDGSLSRLRSHEPQTAGSAADGGTADPREAPTRAIPGRQFPSARSAGCDHLLERRRAVAVARRFRWTDGLSIVQIAARLSKTRLARVRYGERAGREGNQASRLPGGT
jgi:hypothetical protein